MSIFKKSLYIIKQYNYVVKSMTEEAPKIVWKRKVIYNSGSFRISLPIEIAEAFNIEKGQMLQLSVEGKRIIVEKID